MLYKGITHLKFLSVWRKSRYQSYLFCINIGIKNEEVCEIGNKKLLIKWVEELFPGTICSSIFPGIKEV